MLEHLLCLLLTNNVVILPFTVKEGFISSKEEITRFLKCFFLISFYECTIIKCLERYIAENK